MGSQDPSIDNQRDGRLISADLSVESIQKQLERILASKGFVHSERPSRFLRFVVDQTLHGLGHQLKEYLLAVEVLGRRESFDPKTDPIVRVEAGRLRTRLKHYYESEGRDDPVLIEFPKGGYVPTFQERKVSVEHELRIELEAESAKVIEVPKPTVGQRLPYRWRYVIIGGGIVLAVTTIGAIWKFIRSPAPSRGPVFTALTSDTGLTTDPAVSPDGKLLAYASDRSGEGNLDIYVQQIGGGEPQRLTSDKVDERYPSFSPDGTKIVFRSEREEGGVYVMSALGGEQRLIAKGGLNPHFSPDGNWIVYWFSGQRGGDPTIGGMDKIYLVPSTGGQPRQIRPDFDAARVPIWTPDGKYLLFEGTPSLPIPGHLAKEEDWWVTPLNGGKAIKTGARERLGAVGLFFDYFSPNAWSADGNRVVFSAGLGDSANLWQVDISPRTWQLTGAPERLTSGPGLEDQPCVAADGRLVFSSLIYNMNAWSLPVDANQGKVTGELQRVTRNAALDKAFDLSADGRKVVFLSTRSGNWDVWSKDLKTGKETQLTFTPTAEEGWPQMTADGSRISYVRDKEKAVMYVISPDGGIEEKLCEQCCEEGLWNWSSEGKWVLYPHGAPTQGKPLVIGLLNLGTGKKTILLRREQCDLFQGYFSPDDRWITFFARLTPDRTQVFVVPFLGERELIESEWVRVTDGSQKDFKSRWSPDGNLLYFVSHRDGFRCLWAQRLDPITKRPVGAAFEVFPSHRARLSLMNVNVTGLEFSVARDKIVFNLGELTGNIWMANFDAQHQPFPSD